jgi:hypothetical protein
MSRVHLRLALSVFALIVGCAQSPELPDENGVFLPLGPVDTELTSEGLSAEGPPDQAYTTTGVWSVHNAWADTGTSAAKAAGLAWGENSGLTWDEKFALWVDSMTAIPGHSGYGSTFEIETPTGKVLPAPYLECAETAYFLRALFASWYGLPFYVEAVDSSGERIFLGHFGFVTKDGSRYSNTPKFASYDDYSTMTAADIAADGWPQDSGLRARKMYGEGDLQPFIEDEAHFGAYFDELLLNKRTGYFMMMLLPYFGSINLADESVVWHVATFGLRPGDVLVKRWQRRGIGHVMVVKEVQWLDERHAAAEVASGSMPRRQPRWESTTSTKMNFTNARGGGEGTNSDGEDYVDLGGGLKGFLTAVSKSGNWRNMVPAERVADWIPASDTASRAARPAEFEALLSEPDPAELRDELLALIDSKREHLQNYPASCSAREAREQYFDALYDLMQNKWGWDRQQVDEEYRIIDDYVFAELVYSDSKTCCWNSTTNDMYAVVMDYNLERIEDASDTCVEPVVFKAEDGGYLDFEDYADATGRGGVWVAWSADESCPQAGVSNDTEVQHDWTDFCDLEHAPGDDAGSPGGETGEASDSFEPNESAAGSADIGDGTYNGLAIASNDEDWFRIDTDGGSVTASITFDHGAGDLDLELLDEAGNVIDTSTTTADVEAVTGSADVVLVRVYGYSGATGDYALKVVID